MSESFLFAILGFLIACLLGTVFASFLWRRAVSVTTRKIMEDENFAAMDEVADLKADLRTAQNSLAAKEREIAEAQSREARLEAAIAEAEASGEGAAESLKRDLENAVTAAESAEAERDTAHAALREKHNQTNALVAAKDADLQEARTRVDALESAIRTLAIKAAVIEETPEPIADPAVPASEHAITEEPEAARAPEQEGDAAPADQTDEQTVETGPTAPVAKTTPTPTPTEPTTAISRSLEERIEALKQGDTSGA